jgi:hypothetical protein
MMSTDETSTATETPQADQPKVNGVAATPTAPAASVRAPAKKAPTKSPAKKTVAPAKTVASASTPKAAVKSVVKPAAKTVSKPAVKAAPTATATSVAKAQPKAAVAPTAKPKAGKVLKPKKPKLVRDSFTIPKLEYLILEDLKLRSGKLGNSVKKSELLRAGIKALAVMADSNFMAALKAVPAIKTGRPAKN